MNIGNAVKQIQKKYPSVTISRLRFLEKEGLIEPKRSKGGILLHSIFNSTIKNLDKYNFANEPKGALGALKLGGGDCTDYTDLFVALCRARGLPARHVHGILASGFSDTPKHSWAEVYIPHNGWVRLDPFLVEAGKASFRSCVVVCPKINPRIAPDPDKIIASVMSSTFGVGNVSFRVNNAKSKFVNSVPFG